LGIILETNKKVLYTKNHTNKSITIKIIKIVYTLKKPKKNSQTIVMHSIWTHVTCFKHLFWTELFQNVLDKHCFWQARILM
jgi:hypothetical protein